MKTKKVYVVESLVENDFIIFSSKKRANDFIIEFGKKEHIFFDKSKQYDLYLVTSYLW